MDEKMQPSTSEGSVMNLNPATVLDPVFQFFNWIITEWGVYLFLAFV